MLQSPLVVCDVFGCARIKGSSLSLRAFNDLSGGMMRKWAKLIGSALVCLDE